jgi:hypothetical protein
MKYLKRFNKYKLNESNNNYDIYDLEIDFSIAEDYTRDNYDWIEYYKQLGKDIFDFMSDYEKNKYYDHLISEFVKNTTYQDIADYDEERLRNYIKNNSNCYEDNIKWDEDNFDDFDDMVDKLSTQEIIDIFEENDKYYNSCSYSFIYDEAYSNYEHYNSIEEMFDWVSNDEDYYNELENYFDEEKAQESLLDNDDVVRDFYLNDIQTDDELKDELIEFDESNIKAIFHILDKNNNYGRSKEFQIKYIDYIVKNELIYDDGAVNKDDMIDLENDINEKFSITTEAKKHIKKYITKSKARKFNL